MYKVGLTTYAGRKVKKLRGKDKVDFDSVVEKLKNDPFDPKLKSHKLTGRVDEAWSCRMNYSDRVIFVFVITEEKEITIIDLGSHEEVY